MRPFTKHTVLGAYISKLVVSVWKFWYVLTVDMVDVVTANVRVIRLLPAQGQFVADTVSERLRLRKPATPVHKDITEMTITLIL